MNTEHCKVVSPQTYDEGYDSDRNGTTGSSSLCEKGALFDGDDSNSDVASKKKLEKAIEPVKLQSSHETVDVLNADTVKNGTVGNKFNDERKQITQSPSPSKGNDADNKNIIPAPFSKSENSSRLSKKRPRANKNDIKVSLIHSPQHSTILHKAMEHVHKDRDLLLASLLNCCGFLQQTPKFFTIVSPKLASRKHLQLFHSRDYLDLIEFPPPFPTTFTSHSFFDDKSNDSCEHDDSIETENVIPRERKGKQVRFSDESMDAFQNRLNSIHQSVTTTQTPATLSQNKQHYWKLLDNYNLTDDCFIPTTNQGRRNLWSYCRSVAGASMHAAYLLNSDKADVTIHWGGGRHHAHANRAGGFCYVNDIVLAILYLLHYRSLSAEEEKEERRRSSSQVPRKKIRKRVMYIDLDIHHADGVQTAFYDTDQVLTVSLHRHERGFFPASSGATKERGRHGTSGVGYNLNVPMPLLCSDGDFVKMFRRILERVLPEYDPHALVLCVGADGVKGDDLVGSTCGGIDGDGNGGGWNLSPECLAECVRMAADVCAGGDGKANCPFTLKEEGDVSVQYDVDECARGKDKSKMRKKIKLLVLGGGGYNPSNTARAFLLSTAAACEGARPGMLWEELPKDIPQHEYFPRYGPTFELISESAKRSATFQDLKSQNCQQNECKNLSVGNVNDGYMRVIADGEKAIELTHVFLKGKNSERNGDKFEMINFNKQKDEDIRLWTLSEKREIGRCMRSKGRRHRKKIRIASQTLNGNENTLPAA